jgi:plastocyanin
MRIVAIVLVALACFGVTTSGFAGLDLRGSARSGERPEPNAVVWLEAPSAPRSRSDKPVILDQRNLAFSPHVLAVRTGTTVDFPNNDRVFHNVFSFRNGKRFDLGMYPVGTMRRVTFDQPGVSRLYCNIHPNMAAYVIAVDTPYYGIADKSGTFTIPAVPPGLYTYVAWRPSGPILNGTFRSDEAKPLEIRWP